MESEERRVGGFRRQLGGREPAGRRIEARDVDALAPDPV